MERRDLRKRGSIFVEVLISILLFTVGILALTATLLYGVKVIAESREETKNEQNYKNSVGEKALDLINDSFNNTSKPLAQLANPSSIVFKLDKNNPSDSNKTLTLTLYRYKQEGKEGSEMYLLKRGNP